MGQHLRTRHIQLHVRTRHIRDTTLQGGACPADSPGPESSIKHPLPLVKSRAAGMTGQRHLRVVARRHILGESFGRARGLSNRLQALAGIRFIVAMLTIIMVTWLFGLVSPG